VQFQAVLLNKEREWSTKLQKVCHLFVIWSLEYCLQQQKQYERVGEELRQGKRELAACKAQYSEMLAFAEESRTSLVQSSGEFY
jgi:hypothetical protein